MKIRAIIPLGLSLSLCLLLIACGSKDIELEPGQEAPSKALSELNSLPSLSVNWSQSIGQSNSENSSLLPFIGESKAYFASESGFIRAINLNSGAVLWSNKVSGTIDAGVGVGASVAVVGLDNGDVIAYNAETGVKQWQHSLGRIISATPVAGGETVVVRTQDGHVFGLQSANGELVWGIEKPIASLSIGRDGASKIVGEGVLTGFSSGRLLATNLFSGQTFWEKRAFRPQGKNEIDRLIDMDGSPLVLESNIVVGAYQGGIASYQILDGELNWRNESVSTRKSMFVHEDKIIVTGSEGEVSAVSANTGATLWEQSSLVGRALSAPTVFNNQVLVGGLKGAIYALDINSGEIIGRTSLGKSTISSLHTTDNGLVAYVRSSGTLSFITAQ
ncbi:MAG: outer membrane protein assembly factor BamB [Saprospiraceae bacterium]